MKLMVLDTVSTLLLGFSALILEKARLTLPICIATASPQSPATETVTPANEKTQVTAL